MKAELKKSSDIPYARRKNRVHFDLAKNVEDYETVFQAEFNASVAEYLSVLGFLTIENGCCSDRPVLLAAAKRSGEVFYSCQCACGGWCTSGYMTAAAALREYEIKTRQSKELSGGR